MKIIPKAVQLLAVLALAVVPPLAPPSGPWTAGVPLTPTPEVTAGFSDWHLPLPAGKWGISRGPCQSNARFRHDCRYYEERCGVDLVALSGSTEHVPVLAPQAGQVFFMGTRSDAGLMLMLRHADGRVSAYMHLSQVAVGLDEMVRQGQVIAYVGSTGSSGNPHLHFDVQPDAVQRECLALDGLDELHYGAGWALSHNLPWSQLTLPDPPAGLPGWLPTLATSGTVTAGQVVLPAGLAISPTASASLPATAARGVDGLSVGGASLTPAATTGGAAWFRLPFTAPVDSGTTAQTVQPTTGGVSAGPGAVLTVTVRPAPDTSPASDAILINPVFISPPDWSRLRGAPYLCWSEDARAGQAPFEYRVMVAGAAEVDSGWMRGTCWQAPDLPSGTYFWKVFVRDARGFMNRTNQMPLVFVVQ
jgi:hypothetical protein